MPLLVNMIVSLICVANAQILIPQYQSGYESRVVNTNSYQVNTYTVTFSPSFPASPQVILSWSQNDAQSGLIAVTTKVIQSSITSSGFQYSIVSETSHQVGGVSLFWFAFLDDRIFTMYGTQGSTGSTTAITTFTITFTRPQTSVPSVQVFTNGIIFTSASGSETSFEVSVGTPTNTNVPITITPGAGFVLSYYTYSVIYADQFHLQTGQGSPCSGLNDGFQTACCQIFTPIPNLNAQYTGLGINSYDNAGSQIRFNLYNNGQPFICSPCSAVLGQATFLTYSSGSTISSYQIVYFQYIPCPYYCTSCINNFPNCDGCSSISSRTGSDCLTCPSQYYANPGQVQCAACVDYCNNCQGSQSTCTACFGGRNNPPSCTTCTTANYYAQLGTVNCQQCASYCNGCVNASTQCTTCLSTSGRSVVPDCTTCPAQQFILAGVDNCQQCNSNCASCKSSAGQCLSCSPASQTLNIPNCTTCPVQMFFQSSSLSCQSCSVYCNNCQLSTSTCVVCLSSTLRSNPPNCLTCPNSMFIQAGQINCQQCNSICNQCTVSNNNCTACNGLYRTNAPSCNQCTQPNYYIDTSYIDCQPCASYCNRCINSSTNCIACWPFTFQNLTSTCHTCPTNQFTLNPPLCTANTANIVCQTSYNRDSTCNCLPGYYNSDNQLSCLKCSSICETCTSTPTNCLICNSAILLSTPPLCGCQDGYFQLYGSCSQCSSNCANCAQSSSNCLACASPRLNPPLCSCPNGYFNNCTQQCSFQCINCSNQASNCIACSGNRINPPRCNCPDGSIQYSAICSGKNNNIIDCSTAAPTAQYSNDLNSINVIFQYPLNQFTNCNAIFNTNSLMALGNNVYCSVYQNVLTIYLGTNATISTYQPIFINPNILQFSKCNSLISIIVTPIIQPPSQNFPPTLLFNNQQFTTTVCDNVLINIIGQTYSGQRNLQLLSWKIVEADVKDNLEQLIEQWNSNPLQISYSISSKYLQNQQIIKLLVSYQNFLIQQSSSEITIVIQSNSLQLILQVPQQTYIFDTTSISINPQLRQCGANLINQLITVSVAIANETTTLNYNYTLLSDVQQSIIFNPFQLNLKSNYKVKTSAVWKNLYTYAEQQFQVIQYPFRVLILGGDQHIGINQNLNLSAQIFDPNIDIQVDINSYNISWQCVDLITLQQCINFQYSGSAAILNTTGYQTYKTVQIVIRASRLLSIATNNITVNVIENLVSQIQLSGNQYQLNSPINIYNQVDLTIEYQNAIAFDVDNLTYYASYLDQTYSKNVIQLNNLQTSINVQFFDRYQLNSNVKFQVTVNNPTTSTISVSTQNIFVNVAPLNCKISIHPRGHKHSLQIDSCISNSQPLQYQFIYYASNQDYIQDSFDGVIANGIELSEFQISPFFLTYLAGQNTTIIVGRIKDSQNGLSNTSISLNGIKLIDSTMFSFMLQDNSLYVPNNLLLILMQIQTTNETLSPYFGDKISKIVNNLNQSSKLTKRIQQYYISYQSPSQNQILTQLQTVNQFINEISTQLSRIQSDQAAGYYNKNYQVSLLSLEGELLASANYISFLYGQSQQIVLSRRLLDTQIQNITQYVTEGVANITNILGNLTKVNQNQKLINTTEFNLTAQKFSTMNINQNFGLQVINQSNQTVSFKNQNFKVNPYQNQSDFINPVKAPLIVPNLTDVNSVQIKPANPIPISFPLIGNIDISCASQIGGSWSLDVCTLVKSTPVQCLCQTLSPLSIVQALQYILSQFALLFDHTITGKINVFQYQDVIFTYIIACFILIFFTSKFVLHRRDLHHNGQVHPVHEIPKLHSIEDIENLNNQNIKTRQEKKEIIDSVGELKLYTHNSLVGKIHTDTITKKQGFIEFLQNSHVIFELYYRFDSEEPRILRLNTLFLEQFGKICIFVLFGKNLAISIVIGLSLFQTAYGILFQLILSKMMKSKNKYIHYIGILISILITGLCTYLIVAAMALYTSVYQANIAALSYLASFVADYFISNIAVEFGKYMFIIKYCDNEGVYKIYDFILSPGLQEIVFGRKITNNAIQTKDKI